MTTVIARHIASTPIRSAAETWARIVGILAPDPHGPARTELAKAAGIACASIASEATRSAPIVVWGAGPRVRVYCIFDEDAVTGDGVNEDPVPRSPTEGDWRMSIPCSPEDVEWSKTKLASISRRISARAANEDVDDDQSDTTASGAPMKIDPVEFFKP